MRRVQGINLGFLSGVGSSSARDVVVSVRNFREFTFDRENEILTIGAGSLWSEYYEQMKAVAANYSVVAAATPFLGVGGSIIAGGFSLMSREYGCISDPENMLDAEVVKLDGSVVWASSEPDLLWGHRGAYIGLGVVTRFKLRAYKYPQDIWGGSIVIPRTKEAEVAQAISSMDHSKDVENRVFALLLPMPQVFVVNAFDANGEEQGRKSFGPLLEIEGAMDMTKTMDLAGFAQMQAQAEAQKGRLHQWFNPLALGKLSVDLVLKSFDWQRQCAAQGTQATVMYELWGTVSTHTCATGGPVSIANRPAAWSVERPLGFCLASFG
jgi:FAD/FMN-containing dehydrogenase